MKLIIVIVSNNDAEKVLAEIAKNGFFATRISTTGQFLVDGNTAILIGCKDERVKKLYDVIRSSVTKRKIRTAGVTSTISGSLLTQAVDVEENGAVAFTLNVESFDKF